MMSCNLEGPRVMYSSLRFLLKGSFSSLSVTQLGPDLIRTMEPWNQWDREDGEPGIALKLDLSLQLRLISFFKKSTTIHVFLISLTWLF